ncbi:MAG: hypothetical protein KGZ83_19800 [Sulfuricella sp.]|nr:hypothetical protein [Sulfuricella sp.]
MNNHHSFKRTALAVLALVASATAFAASDDGEAVKNRSSEKTTVKATSSLSVSLNLISITQGNSAAISVSGAAGQVVAFSGDTSVATVNYANKVATVKGLKAGATTITIKDSSTAKTIPVFVLSSGSSTSTATTSNGYALLAWNDLGMHCVDGKDYSVFSILPPYNNLHAQLVNKATGKQVVGGVTLSYESYADDTVPKTDPLYGSINTVSSTKTNFWQYMKSLFGIQLSADHGLNLSDPTVSNPTPSRTPAPLKFDPAKGWFVAEGIPIVPVDDKGMKNFYPMVKVTARDATGKVLASARTVLPVSDEMTCKACHASTTSTNPAAIAARPLSGWVNDLANPEKDWKKNILRLHDDKKMADPLTKTSYVNALSQAGYDPAGLYVTATKAGGKPVLCASCHSSNALASTGLPGIRALTHALHTKHADVKDPASQLALNDINNRTSCYQCHPGSLTQCLRGAMGNAKDAAGNMEMGCQNCHGTMKHVGNTARTGWLSQPNCQACHHDGKRETVGVNTSGQPLAWADARFATNLNTPASGFSLYRFSKGHGGLQCEACHGATHAEYPSSHSQDNALSMDLQGHGGTVAECTACHATAPITVNGGPHGMHTTGDNWVASHGDQVERAGSTACAYCHGADYRGTPLSQIKKDKSFRVENGTKAYKAGQNVSCYDCHNGPKSADTGNLLRKIKSARSSLAAGDMDLKPLGYLSRK